MTSLTVCFLSSVNCSPLRQPHKDMLLAVHGQFRTHLVTPSSSVRLVYFLNFPFHLVNQCPLFSLYVCVSVCLNFPLHLANQYPLFLSLLCSFLAFHLIQSTNIRFFCPSGIVSQLPTVFSQPISSFLPAQYSFSTFHFIQSTSILFLCPFGAVSQLSTSFSQPVCTKGDDTRVLPSQ